MHHPHRLPSLILGATLAGAALAPAHSDSGRRMPAHVPAAYTQECGACHLAYPPSLLPARSWQRLMTGLDRHYGSDASLDTAQQQQIGTWLQAYAGSYNPNEGVQKANGCPQVRIRERFPAKDKGC